MITTIVTIIASAALGFAVGILSGLLGVGGGVIMLPVFRLLYGMSPLGSTATSLFTIIPTSASGALSHIRGKTCLPKLGVALGLGGACTSALGVALAQRSPSWLVMVAAAAVIGYSGFTMLQKALKLPKSPSATDQLGKASGEGGGETAGHLGAASGEKSAEAAKPIARADQNIERMRTLAPRDIVKAVAIGMAAGMASGFVGLGGGFIMVPLMVAVLGLPMRLASGTSLIAVMILALPATIAQCALGNVDYLAGIAVACGSIPGAMLGARLMNRVPERTLRLTFAAFLAVAAVMMLVKETGALG